MIPSGESVTRAHGTDSRIAPTATTVLTVTRSSDLLFLRGVSSKIT